TGPKGPTGNPGAPTTALWAIVNDDGTLRQGRHVVSTAKIINSEYAVIFDQDVSACAYEVTQRPVDSLFDAFQMVYQATAKAVGNPDRVEVRVKLTDGSTPTTQQNFSLAVFC